jgi:hypothetical protein
MKKYLLAISIILLFFSFCPIKKAGAADWPVKLKGWFVLQSQDKGQLWYINPVDSEKYYFYNADSLFKIVKAVGLGISNKNFNSLNKNKLTKLSGRILIKVEDSGKAFYVEPVTLKLISLGRPNKIFRILAGLSIGLNNQLIAKIKVKQNFSKIINKIKEANKPVETDQNAGNNSGQTATTTNNQAEDKSTGTSTATTTLETTIATTTPTCQFLAEYFSNRTLFGEPATTTYVDAINFDWQYGAPDGVEVINKFSARWTGKCYFTAGQYKFNAIFDDAMNFSLDNETIIKSWTDNDRTRYFETTRDISEGEHDIKVEYYDYYCKAKAILTWVKI